MFLTCVRLFHRIFAEKFEKIAKNELKWPQNAKIGCKMKK